MQRYTPRRIVLWILRIYGPCDVPTVVVMARRYGVTFRDTNSYISDHLRDGSAEWVEVVGKQRLDVTSRGRALCRAADEPVPVVNPLPERRMAAARWLWGQR